MIRKFKPAILILFFLSVNFGLATESAVLEKADSLFIAQKYTAAFELYDQVQQSGFSSPSMLLKMAFIKEGLGDYTSSLYYLHFYYEATADRAVLTKMSELADKKSLSGYKVEDRHFFINALNKFALEIQIALAATILLLTFIVYRSKKKNELPIGVPVIQVILLVALLIIANDWLEPKQAIITENTFVMTAPSAASEPIGSINKGHLVEIIEQTDVWTKIRWEDKEVYIRKAKLKTL